MILKRTLALLAAVPALFAAGHFDDKVRADFFSGMSGNKAALERAMAASADAIDTDPKFGAEALAWHGAGLLFLSGQKFQQGDMAAGGELWGKSMAEMKQAGEREPDNPAVLIPRAAAWFASSRFTPPEMGRPILKLALADYEHVYDIQRGIFDKLDLHMRTELLFGLADGYKRDENPEKARVYFEKIAALGPAAGHYDQAVLYLAGKDYTVTGIGCVGCHASK